MHTCHEFNGDSVYTVSVRWMRTMQNLNFKFKFCTHVMNLTVIIYTLSVYIKFTLKIYGLIFSTLTELDEWELCKI